MDNMQDKKRTTLAYILAAIFLVIVVVASNVYTNYRIQQRKAAAGETETQETQTEEAPAEEEDKTHDQLTVETSVYGAYVYRTVTDASELAELGLPASVSDEDMGGKFATAENQIVLYAYPRYACRAVLIGNNSDKYSFCILDSFTDNQGFGTLEQIPQLYGIHAASGVRAGQLIKKDGTVVTLDGDTVEQIMNCFPDCVNNNAKTTVPNGIVISLEAGSGLSMKLSCDQNFSIVSILGESYKISEGLRSILESLNA